MLKPSARPTNTLYGVKPPVFGQSWLSSRKGTSCKEHTYMHIGTRQSYLGRPECWVSCKLQPRQYMQDRPPFGGVSNTDNGMECAVPWQPTHKIPMISGNPLACMRPCTPVFSRVEGAQRKKE